MAVYGAFSSSMLGMMSQSQALNTIGMNVANVMTGGYKATDTRFSTVLSQTVNHVRDLGGVKPMDYQRIDQGGTVTASARNLDVSINGQGFFVVNTKFDGTGDTYFTRDGSFNLGIGEEVQGVDDGGNPVTRFAEYLVDGNGYYVQGWDVDFNGNFVPGSPSKSLRLDDFAFNNVGQASSEADLRFNLPAQTDVGHVEGYNARFFDNEGTGQDVLMSFTKTGVNTWDMSGTYNDGTTTIPPVTLAFDELGALVSPTNTSVALAFDGGTTATVDLDLTDMSQFAGAFTSFYFRQNGFAASTISSFSFNNEGNVMAQFADSTQRSVYKLSLGVFANPNALQMKSGNLFQESVDSGAYTLTYAQSGGYASFNPFSRELSNVDMADEFSKMIMTQNAYNSSATVFRTVDEMTSVAKDLKR